MRLLLALMLLALAGPANVYGQQSTESPSPAAGPTVAAEVNDEQILVAEVDALVDANLSAVPVTPAQRKQLRLTLLDDLIDERLIRQFLAKNAPKVDAEEIAACMTVLKARLVKENKTLADHLKKTGQTEAQLVAEWTAAIQLSNYVKQQVTDDQLRAFFAANRDQFDRAEVRVSHIMIRIGKNTPPVERAAAREKLMAIRADIQAGRLDFAAAVKKYSQCHTARTGGDLGFMPRRGIPEDEPIARAAFASKVGTLSEVVETDYGMHLLTVTDRKAGTPTTIEKCIVEVLEAYTEDFRTKLAARLRKEGKVRITLQ